MVGLIEVFLTSALLSGVPWRLGVTFHQNDGEKKAIHLHNPVRVEVRSWLLYVSQVVPCRFQGP